MLKRLDSIRLDCEKEMSRLQGLQQQRMKLEAVVRQFENSNEGYVKIRKTVEEKVVSILSDKKMLLKLALLSLTESIRTEPDKYGFLVHHNNTPSTADYINQYYDTASYGQGQYQSQDYTAMILDEAEKLYNKLTKEMLNTTITDYASSILSSLPMLSQSDEKEQTRHSPPTAT
jgi:hypothetical protein